MRNRDRHRRRRITTCPRGRLLHDLNVAPIPRQPIPREVFALVDLLIVNETEAAALTGAPVTSLVEAQRAATRLLALGARATLITLGERGSLWYGDYAGEIHTIETPAYPVTPVDATGAGDAFCGALACAFAESRPLPDALNLASARSPRRHPHGRGPRAARARRRGHTLHSGQPSRRLTT